MNPANSPSSFVPPDLMPAAPEIFLLTMACLILVIDAFVDDPRRNLTYLLTQLTLIGTALITLSGFDSESVTTFNGSFIRDPMGDLLKLTLYLSSIAALVYSRDYLRQRNLFKGEFLVLVMGAVLGMMVMISAGSLLTVYLGLELLSLSLYALVAMDRDNGRASEAAMKYFVLGALASGLLLYGISMLYGATGTIDLIRMAALVESVSDMPVFAFGLVFVVVGLAFKLGAVPFHMWVPDVYHGAPTPVTLLIGTAPKLAAFALVMRVLVSGLESMSSDWSQMMIMLAVLSLVIGNIAAIAQQNIKRMLAYSTISHVGFLVLGFAAATPEGYSASLFYTVVYVLTALGGFGMILLLTRAGFEAEELNDFRGLNQRSPWFAFMLLLFFFSMAGVPPTVGFYAKLAVLESVVAVDQIWLAIVAVAFALVGAFYYLRVIKIVYFDSADEDAPRLDAPVDFQVLLSANGLSMLLLGLLPGGLMTICTLSIAALV